MTSTDRAPEEHDAAVATPVVPDAPAVAPAVEGAAAPPPSLPAHSDVQPDAQQDAQADGPPHAQPGAQAGVATDASAEPRAPAADRPDLSPQATGARLAELFPALFVGPDGNGTWKPIKLRIHADIQARAPGQFSKRALGIFFARYTTTTAYLKALAAPGAHRHDLDGQPAGEIAEEHRSAAAEEVARRQAIAAERRAAQREAHLRAQREARKATAQPARAQPGADERARRHERPAARPGDRAPQRPPRPASQHPRNAGGPPRAAPDRAMPAPSEPAGAAPRDDDDPARRERAALLRAFESSTLTKSNFCVLKRIDEKALDEALEMARKERAAPPRRA